MVSHGFFKIREQYPLLIQPGHYQMMYFLMLEYHHPLVRLVCWRMQRSPNFADHIPIIRAILRNSSRKIVGHLNLCIAPIVDKLSHWTNQRFAQFIFRTHLSAMLIAPPATPFLMIIPSAFQPRRWSRKLLNPRAMRCTAPAASAYLNSWRKCKRRRQARTDGWEKMSIHTCMVTIKSAIITNYSSKQ